jgi:hypothetical protein
MPIFLDSPLSIRLTDVYMKYDNTLIKQLEISKKRGHLFDFPGLRKTMDTETQSHT